jgi:hypothetical protein
MQTFLSRLQTATCRHHIQLYELCTYWTSSCMSGTHFGRCCMKMHIGCKFLYPWCNYLEYMTDANNVASYLLYRHQPTLEELGHLFGKKKLGHLGRADPKRRPKYLYFIHLDRVTDKNWTNVQPAMLVLPVMLPIRSVLAILGGFRLAKRRMRWPLVKGPGGRALSSPTYPCPNLINGWIDPRESVHLDRVAGEVRCLSVSSHGLFWIGHNRIAPLEMP